MSSSFSRYLIVFLLLILGVVSWWTVFKMNDRPGLNETASAIAPIDQTEDSYVSLIDVIASSLERIKNRVESPASSTEVTIEETTEVDVPVPDKTTTPVDLAEAIVNIYCVYTTDEYKRAVSGTGFLINDQGAILTNAHVAQYLLLKDSPKVKDASCQVRIGQEAGAAYNAELLYISPTWVIKHAGMIASSTPRGTGENDFALLYITEGIGDVELPSDFPHIPPSTNTMKAEMKGHTVIVVGYPSEKDISIDSQKRAVATSTITEIYTFESGLADIFSLSESRLGRQGASGGPVIDHLGHAIGVVTTKDAGSSALNAITMAYIDRSMKDETGFDLTSVMQGNLSFKAKLFNETMAPILQELLTSTMQ